MGFHILLYASGFYIKTMKLCFLWSFLHAKHGSAYPIYRKLAQRELVERTSSLTKPKLTSNCIYAVFICPKGEKKSHVWVHLEK